MLIMESVFQFLKKVGVVSECDNDYISTHDGCMVLSSKVSNQSNLLKGIENEVKEKTGFEVNFSVKPFDDPYDLTGIEWNRFKLYRPCVMAILEKGTLSHNDFTEFFTSLYGKGNIVYSEYTKNIYIYKEVREGVFEWAGDVNNAIVTTTVRDICQWALTRYMERDLKKVEKPSKKRKSTEEEEDIEKNRYELYAHTYKSLMTAKERIGNVTFYEKVAQDIVNSSRTYDGDKYVFDVGDDQLENINFQNGVLHVPTKTFRKREKTDFVTHWVPYDYKDRCEVPEECFDYIKTLFGKIHVDSQKRDDCLSFLSARGLMGNKTMPVFKMARGSGNNAKTTEADIFESCFPCYCSRLSDEVLDGQKSENANRLLFEVATRPVRLAIIDDASKVSAGRLKNFTNHDLGTIKKLHSNESLRYKLQATVYMSSNIPIIFHGEVDGGVQRRGVYQEYTSSFSTENDVDNYEEQTFVCDQSVKTVFKNDNNYKLAFLHTLLDYTHEIGDINNLGWFDRMNRDFKQNCFEADEYITRVSEYFELCKQPDGKVDHSKVVHKTSVYASVKRFNNRSVKTTTIHNALINWGAKYVKNKTLRGFEGQGVFTGLSLKQGATEPTSIWFP